MQLASAILQGYAWGFFVSLALFLLVMMARGVGPEGYTEHVAACIGLSLTWPYTWYEIIQSMIGHYGG